MPARVLVYVRDPTGVWVLPTEQMERLRHDFRDVAFDTPANRGEVQTALPGADAVYGWAVRPENFALARRLKWIHVSAAGVGPALFPALVQSDVVLTNGRGLHAVAMAEHTIGVLLAFARKLHLARDAQHERRWIQAELVNGTPPFGELEGATLGIVGFGGAGAAVAVRARALGMKVIAVRAHPAAPPDPAHEQWGADRLDELIGIADALVLVPALTAETTRLIGAARLGRMKPGAVLVNLGRGGLIDEPALIAALERGPLAGAALDVTEQEPLPPESPLWGMPNVILTPHVSGVGPRYWARATDQFAANLRAFLAGEPLRNVVDKTRGY